MQTQNIGYYILNEAADPDILDSKIVQHNKLGNRVIAEGTLQRTGSRNRNGRTYLKTDLEPELSAPRQKELFKAKQMKGEAGHPDPGQGGLARQQTIDPNNTVAVFQKFWTDGDFVMGTFMGDENELGASFDRELRKGRKPSWSLRALGNIKNTSRGAEVKNIRIITYDRVIYPSHDKAYTLGLVSEGASIITPDGSKLFLDERDRGMQIPIVNESVIKYIQSESANYKLFKEFFDLNYNEATLINNGKQVQLTDKAGSIFIMNLEAYIHDEIMNACINRL